MMTTATTHLTFALGEVMSKASDGRFKTSLRIQSGLCNAWMSASKNVKKAIEDLRVVCNELAHESINNLIVAKSWNFSENQVGFYFIIK